MATFQVRILERVGKKKFKTKIIQIDRNYWWVKNNSWEGVQKWGGRGQWEEEKGTSEILSVVKIHL